MNEFEWHLLEDHTPVESLLVGGVPVKSGDLVRLRPKAGGDIMDLALANMIARVTGIEQDYEGRIHVAVVVDADPGKDLGLLRQPGHQFFFEPDEVEPILQMETVVPPETKQPRILLAGIGNIFVGDDGFGVEVIQRIRSCKLPSEVKIVDFGIRGFDLAYALLEPYETVILVDACPRGDVPGTLYVIEPDVASIAIADPNHPPFDAHAIDPVNVLRLAKSLGPLPSGMRILLLGCEPLTFGPEEGQLGLSDQVSSAVDRAVTMLQEMVLQILAGRYRGSAN